MARTLFAALAFAAIVSAQPIPSYKSQEDYCYHNPDMPTCIKGKPFEMQDLQKGMIYQPKAPATKAPVRTAPAAAPVRPSRSEMAPPPQLTIPQARRVRGAP